jgi:hypothetical protein
VRGANKRMCRSPWAPRSKISEAMRPSLISSFDPSPGAFAMAVSEHPARGFHRWLCTLGHERPRSLAPSREARSWSPERGGSRVSAHHRRGQATLTPLILVRIQSPQPRIVPTSPRSFGSGKDRNATRAGRRLKHSTACLIPFRRGGSILQGYFGHGRFIGQPATPHIDPFTCCTSRSSQGNPNTSQARRSRYIREAGRADQQGRG